MTDAGVRDYDEDHYDEYVEACRAAELGRLRIALQEIASSDFASAHSKRIAREALNVR